MILFVVRINCKLPPLIFNIGKVASHRRTEKRQTVREGRDRHYIIAVFAVWMMEVLSQQF